MRSVAVETIRRLLAGEPVEQDVVLPRLLRRPVRALSRAEWTLPRHIGLKALALFFGATAVTGMIVGDHTGSVVSYVTAKAGLGIDRVLITGQSETSEVDVLDRLAIGEYPSLITLDVDAARARIESLPWVAQATLKKLYPDTLEVVVRERSPFALWQNGESVSLIDREGAVISTYIDERYVRLPLVVGEGANKRVAEFLDILDAYPALKSRVRAGVLVSDRRWNVVLAEAMEILLPEKDPRSALERLATLDADSQILSRDIASVDMRVPERLVVQLSEGAFTARQAMLKERAKLARKKGTNI